MGRQSAVRSIVSGMPAGWHVALVEGGVGCPINRGRQRVAKSGLQTQILGRRCSIPKPVDQMTHEESLKLSGTGHWPRLYGQIVSAWVDADGIPQYTVLLDDGRLMDRRGSSIEVVVLGQNGGTV